jgi:glutathione S-transferase
MQQKTADFSAINPLQRVPALVLDDGTVIAESMAICRYFEELRPEPPLFGRGAKEAAIVEMWNRRMELNLLAPVAAVFRHLHPAMAEMEQPQVAAWGEANKSKTAELLDFLNNELKHRLFIAGDHYTVADITGMVAIDFMKPSKMSVPESLTHVRRWHAQVSARASAKA